MGLLYSCHLEITSSTHGTTAWATDVRYMDGLDRWNEPPECVGGGTGQYIGYAFKAPPTSNSNFVTQQIDLCLMYLYTIRFRITCSTW